MSNAIILFEDYVASGTLGGGSYQLPLSNAQNPRLGLVARSSDATTASTTINIDFGFSRSIDALVLGVPNASPGAQYRVRSFDDAGRVTVSYDSGTKSLPGVVVDSLTLEWEDPGFWYGVNTEEALTEFPTWIIEVIPNDHAANAEKRWWTVDVIDTGNADGFLDFSRLMAGRAFKPTINYTEDNTFGLLDMVDVSESLGGQRTCYERGLRRTLRLTFQNQEQDLAFSDIFRMMVKARSSRQVFVIPDYADDQFLQERSFLATFKQIPAIQQILVARANTAVDLEEVL